VAAIPAFAFGGTGLGSGIQIQGARTNLLFQSKTFTTTLPVGMPWTNVGGGPFAVDQSVGTLGPDGLSGIWQITTNGVNQGKLCNVAVACANNTFTASVYIAVGGANVSGVLSISGTGGTPETTTLAFTATTTWQRISITKAFSGAATGNAQIQFTINNNGAAMFFDDAMVEQNNTFNSILAPSPYIASTTGLATASSVLDNLNYPSSNLNITTGTLSLWVNPMFAQNEGIASVPKFVFTTDTLATGLALYYWPNTTEYFLDWKGGNSLGTGVLTFSRGTWHHILVTWSLSGANVTLKIFYDGVKKNEATGAATALTAGVLQYGGRVDLNNAQSGEYILGRSHVWNTVLNDSEAPQVYAQEKRLFGL